MKVIHGTMEIANQMHTMVEGLKRLAVDAKSLNYYPNYFDYKSDIVVNINSFKSISKAVEATKELADRIIPEYDVFHYHFGTSLFYDNSDLPLLKGLHKKVLMHHWGSDVRIYSQAVKLSPYVKVKIADENSLRKRLEWLSRQIDTCIVSDYELYEYVKDYYPKLAVIPQVINLDEYAVSKSESSNKRLTIVHAPSSPEIKGTPHVMKAVEELRNKYDFDFKLIHGMKHEEAKKIFASADIIIDQLLIGTYGMFSIESMSLGKPVICWISEFMKEKYPEGLPVISANPDNIRGTLEFLLNNRDCLKEVGEKSREYIEKYHDISKINQKLLDLYQEP